MFNWTTTTFINELPEKFIAQPVDKVGTPIAGRLRIGDKLFEKRWVESIRVAEGHDYELCEATLSLDAVKTAITKYDSDHETKTTVARLYIYVGLEGSEESIYANDWYRKGMPLSVSFTVGSATDMAKAIVDTVKDFNVFTKVKKVLDVTHDGSGNLTIKGTHEHQRLQKIAVLVEDVNSVMHEETAVVEYVANRKTDTAISGVKTGVNGFGTYSQLVKDLSLPTAANTHWTSVTKDYRPVIGAIYDQYIITYYAPSTANPSFTAIGNRSMSETTHVFWVKHELQDEWVEYLEAHLTDEKLLTVKENTTDTTVTTVDGDPVVRTTNKKVSLVERVGELEKKHTT